MNKKKVVVAFCALLGIAVTGTGLFGYYSSWNLPGHLPGAHARFESGCQACHEPWNESFDAKCMKCHERALTGNSHGRQVMAKPSKADVPHDLANLSCASCHKQHIKKGSSSFTGPSRFCQECHKAGSVNARHLDLESYSCASTGCHPYHFNSPRDLGPQGKTVRLLTASKLPPKAPEPVYKKISQKRLLDMQNGKFYKSYPLTSARYEIGPHFGTEATCERCHRAKNGEINLAPSINKCTQCHEVQTETFAKGRHGTPYGLGIEPANGDIRVVDCATCHNAHSLRLDNSRSRACIGCHEGEHARNSLKSLHSIYINDPVFKFNELKGADCATCHMPKLIELNGYTDHNESWSSTSKKRMANVVCARCHPVNFALKSLWAKNTIESGFTYSPDSQDEAKKPIFEMSEQ